MDKNYNDLTVKDVLEKLKSSVLDTKISEEIFKIEEGKEDKLLKNSTALYQGRRDWIILWEIYGKHRAGSKEQPNQNFHLKNYLEFRIKNGLNEDENFVSRCYRYIRNAALILYIRETIFGEDKLLLEVIAKRVNDYYTKPNNKENKKMNTAQKYAKS